MEKEPRRVEEIAEKSVGDKIYLGKFKGKGFITSDQDDGSFLSTFSRREQGAQFNEETFDIRDLFPAEWAEGEVEFEIDVKGRLVQDPKPVDPSTGYFVENADQK